MASNYQEFVTKVKLNTEEAQNNLEKLRKETETWVKKRDSLISGGGSKKDVNDLTKLISKNERAMAQLEKQTHNVIDTINNLDGATLAQLTQTEKALNAEMRKTPQNTQYFHELTEKLQQVKTQIAAVRNETKSTFTEQQQLNLEIQNMNNVLANINTSSIKELAMAEATLKRQMQEAVPNSSGYNSAAANLQQVQTRIRQINAEQKEIVRTIDKYDEEIKQAHKDMTTTRRETELIDRTLKNLDKSKVRDIEYSIKILNENLKGTEKGTEDFKRMTNQLKQLKGQLAAINQESEVTESRWSRTVNFFNRNWGVFTQGIALVSGLSFTIRRCISSFAEMEEAMANTRKYTGLTDEGVRELNESLKEMDTRTSREELNELAGAAGRLGITSKDQILEFVDAADKINVALGDDLGEGAIDQVGKLAMAFGEDDRLGLRGAMLATGSAINELAQNSSANAGYLVDFTARVGSFGKALGLTQAQIMGFGAVMDENLLQDEMAATAFGNMLTKMQTDTATFAKIAGMDVKKFSDLIKNDANGAVLALADNLRKQDPSIMMKMLDDMGLDGSRAVAVISTLADKIDDVRKHQKLATEAYAEQRSVIEEYDTMNTTVQAQLDKAKNGFHEVTVELGQKLQPAATALISTGSLAVKFLSLIIGFTTKHWKVLAVLTSGVIAYTIAVNRAMIVDKWHIVTKTLSNALDKVSAALIAAKTAALTAWGVIVDLVTGKVTLATAAQQLWNKVIMSNPYIAAAAAVMGLVSAIIAFVSSADEATESQKRLNEVQKEAINSTQGERAELTALVETARNKALSDDARKEALKKLQDKYPDYLKNLKLETINSTKAKTAIDNLTLSLIEEAKARILVNKIQEAEEKKASLDEKYFKGISGVWQNFLAVFGAGTNDIMDKTERLFNVIKFGDTEAWNMKTWIEEGGYAINNVTYLWQEYRHEVAEMDKEIAAYNKELKNTVTIQSQLKPNESGGNDDDNNNGLTVYETEAERKKEEQERKAAERKKIAAQRKEEAERRKAEAQKKKDYQEEMKAEKAHQDALLLQNYLHFAQESHNLEEFRQKELEIRQSSIDAQIAIAKKYHGEDANETATLLKQKEELQKDYNEMSYKLREEDIKHSETMAKMQAQRDFHTMGSDIFNDESALQQRLSQIELTSLEERIAMMKEKNMEGTAEYLSLQNDYEEKKAQAAIDSELFLLQKLDEYREQWGQLSNDKQMAIAMQGLDMLHKNELLGEEEYQKMKIAIQAQYAKNPVEQKNENFDQNVNDAIANAKANATGGYDKTQALSMSNNPLIGQVNQYKSVMEQLKTMREQDKISHAEYEQAKSQVTSEFLTKMVSNVQAAYDSVNNVMSAASSFYAAQSQYEQAVTTKKYDAMIEKAGSNTAKGKKLEEKKQKELAKIKSKYNKKQMKIEMAQAVASTAMAAINSYASASKEHWWLGAIAAAMATAAGMMQIATIKKQHAAEEAGYYEGGFTGGSSYRKKAGIVHEGEFVVNHDGVNNQNLMPVLRLFDQAQKNNTIGRLTATDVSRQLGQGNAAVVAPVLNVQNDSAAMSDTMNRVTDSVERLNRTIENGIPAHVHLDGNDGLMHRIKQYNRLQNNK